MVSVAKGIYVCPYFYCAGISASVLYVSAIYAQEGTGAEVGSVACDSGERHWFYGVYPDFICKASDEFFQADAFCVSLSQYISGNSDSQCDPYVSSENQEPGAESETYSPNRIQQGGRAVRRPYFAESPVGIYDPGNPGG